DGVEGLSVSAPNPLHARAEPRRTTDHGPPMKLALVTRRYPPLIGGAEKVLSYLAVALAAEGAEVAVVTSRMPGLGLAAWEDVPIEVAMRAGRTGQPAPG